MTTLNESEIREQYAIARDEFPFEECAGTFELMGWTWGIENPFKPSPDDIRDRIDELFAGALKEAIKTGSDFFIRSGRFRVLVGPAAVRIYFEPIWSERVRYEDGEWM